MMQFASKGQWGNGLYFAKEAGYSDIYASKGNKMQPGTTDMKPDESEMILAELLLGDVIELDRDKDTTMGGQIEGIRKYCHELKVPPHINGTRYREGDGADIATSVPRNPPPTPAELSDEEARHFRSDRFNTVRGYTQTDLPPRSPGNATDGWIKNPSCPRSQVWIVRFRSWLPYSSDCNQ